MALMKRQRLVSAALGVLCVLAAATVSIAAKARPGSGKAPELAGSAPVWAILITVVALAGISTVAFKNARRNRAD
jgi:hypothetical protein